MCLLRWHRPWWRRVTQRRMRGRLQGHPAGWWRRAKLAAVLPNGCQRCGCVHSLQVLAHVLCKALLWCGMRSHCLLACLRCRGLDALQRLAARRTGTLCPVLAAHLFSHFLCMGFTLQSGCLEPVCRAIHSCCMCRALGLVTALAVATRAWAPCGASAQWNAEPLSPWCAPHMSAAHTIAFICC